MCGGGSGLRKLPYTALEAKIKNMFVSGRLMIWNTFGRSIFLLFLFKFLKKLLNLSVENRPVITYGSVPVENWIWLRSIFIIGRVWWRNWYSVHINLNNGILWGIIPICRIFAQKWHFLFRSGGRYSFWPFVLTWECALHFWPCERRRKTYFACGLTGFSKTKRWIPE